MAADFLKALRGKRSQVAFCRRLGYRSNVVYTWESKRGFPTAAKTLQAARKVGIDLEEAITRFYRYKKPPPWLGKIDLASRDGVAELLTELKGHTSIVDLANYSGKSRFAIARWLKGETEPKLPEFFLLIECTSLRLIDFIETLVDPAHVPSIRDKWQAMEVARRLAYDAPWTQAVMRALELDEAQRLERIEPEWIAHRVGVAADEVERCLGLLEQTGQIKRDGERWRLDNVSTLDTRKDPDAARRLRVWWGKVGLDRAAAGRPGLKYNLFSVSAKDLERLRQLETAYLNEMRTIIAQSEPMERIVLATVQLLELGDEPTAQPG